MQRRQGLQPPAGSSRKPASCWAVWPRAFGLGLPDMRGEDCDDRAHNLILDGKDVLDLAVVVLGPAVSPCRSIDQLGGDANAVAPPPHAAFQHIAHAELAADLADIGRLALVLEAGIAGDHEQLAEPRQLRDDVFDDAVGEILLLRIGAKVDEGQNGDGGLVRESEGASAAQPCRQPSRLPALPLPAPRRRSGSPCAAAS